MLRKFNIFYLNLGMVKDSTYGLINQSTLEILIKVSSRDMVILYQNLIFKIFLGEYLLPDGRLLKGNWINEKLHGKGLICHPNSKTISTEWNNGV